MSRSRVLALLLLTGLTAAPAVYGQSMPEIGLQLTPRVEREAVHAGDTLLLALEVRLAPGFHVQSDRPVDEFLIPTRLSFDPPGGIEVTALAYPEAVKFLQAETLELLVFEEQFVIGARLVLDPDVAPGTYTIPATFGYQACDDMLCYAPAEEAVEFRVNVVSDDRPVQPSTDAALFAALRFDAADGATGAADRAAPRPAAAAEADDVLDRLARFEVLGTTGGYQPADDFLEFIRTSESGEGQRGWFDGRGPLAIVLLTLIGGLALNLTPCVLPMIPINLAIIGAGSQAGSRGRGFALGAMYGAAMAAVYGLLGLVVILTAGTFGTINASPWFNLGITVLFVVLGLAMFDVITIDFSRLQSRFGVDSSSRGSFLLAFGMGGIAALLAGACVAPVVIQVVVFASSLYARGVAIALALPFLLGVGMALPWPVAGAGLSWLPKPGPWMVRVKQAMGVFILATAAYYGILAYGLFAQRWVDPAAVADSVEELLAEGWVPTLSQGLAQAEEEGRLVLVDIWATWCKNCLTMDKTTLKDAEVQSALADYVKVKFQAEDLNASPAAEVMKRFEAIGLPAYAILRPLPE